jgi:hypothetical protein
MPENLLIISPVYPYPPIGANQQGIGGRIPIFKAIFKKVVLACYSQKKKKIETKNDTIVQYIKINILPRKWQCSRNQVFYNREAVTALADMIRQNQIDVVWIEYSKLAGLVPYIRAHFPDIEIFVRAHNFELFHFLEKHWINIRKRLRPNFGTLLKDAVHILMQEKIMLRYADWVVCISSKDRNLYPICRKKLKYLPDILPTFPRHRVRGKIDRLNVFYMGSNFNNNINLAGLDYIVNRIIPLSVKHNLDLTIYVFGKDIPDEMMQQASVYFKPVGFVADLNSILEEMDAALIPVKYGFGMKTKTYEAMARGFPVLGFKRAFRGFNVRHKRNALIFKNQKEFLEMFAFLRNADNRLQLSTGALEIADRVRRQANLTRLFRECRN